MLRFSLPSAIMTCQMGLNRDVYQETMCSLRLELSFNPDSSLISIKKGCVRVTAATASLSIPDDILSMTLAKQIWFMLANGLQGMRAQPCVGYEMRMMDVIASTVYM